MKPKKTKRAKRTMPLKCVSSSKKRILIVEDEKPILETLRLKLGASGFDVAIALNGHEALLCLQNGCYDLILLDLVMPKKDGFEVLAELSRQGSPIPVFVVTNLGQEEDAARCKELGACEYFVKADIPIASIVDRIEMLFS